MRGARRSPSMYDVAALAGVSHQTVSRVLNGSAATRPETRARVLAAIGELGYRRNLAATALATNRSRAIGVLAPASADFGPVSTMYAVERAARAAGYQALVASATAEPADVRAALEALLRRSVEALAVIAPHRAVLEALAERDVGIPLVVLQTGEPGGVGIAVDQGAGVRLVLDHLTDLGHRRIQHVAGPADHLEARRRRDEFAREIRRRSLPALPVVEGGWSGDAGYRAAAAIREDVTAVFCANDAVALGLVHALADAGRDVPGEVSVIGFDGSPESAHFRPPLTTVRQDFAEVGHRAVRHLLAWIETGEPPRALPVDPLLLVRASTAPPR